MRSTSNPGEGGGPTEAHLRSRIAGFFKGGAFSFGGTVLATAVIYSMTLVVARLESMTAPKRGRPMRAGRSGHGLSL